MVEESRPRLGRGLAALIGDAAETGGAPDRERGQRRVPIEFLRANPRNPRKSFDDGHLDELTASIREKGVIQPIVVRQVSRGDTNFEIIAGERRWRAAQKAGVHDVPVVVVEATDREALELAIVENVQRADLNAIEEARGYEQLMSEFGYTQADLAKVIGKSRSHVANTLRLMNLSGDVRGMVESGALSAGHARALLTVENPDSLAKQIVDQDLSVREAERLARGDGQDGETPPPPARPKAAKDADTRDLEKTLSDTLGLLVSINHTGKGGELRVKYKTLEQLEELCQRLRRQFL